MDEIHHSYETIVGTCSICAGPVKIPVAYHSIIPPKPRCGDCGAVAKRGYEPKIDMERPPPINVNRFSQYS